LWGPAAARSATRPSTLYRHVNNGNAYDSRLKNWMHRSLERCMLDKFAPALAAKSLVVGELSFIKLETEDHSLTGTEPLKK
jgi:hypothetical protein